MMRADRARLIAAGILALGIAAGGWAVGEGFVRARTANRAVTVRGVAERDVTADLATWTLDYSATATDLATLQPQIDHDTQAIMALLGSAGFAPGAVELSGTNVNQFRDSHGDPVTTIRQRLTLRTTRVMAARAAFARQTELVRQGVALQEGSGILYSFTRLNDVKPAMIAAATQDARAGAQQFARDSGASVGAIRHATQGYFTIGARDGAEGEGGGSGERSPFQKVRVVTTIDFDLG